MQNKKTDILCIYDARMRSGTFVGMFNAYTEKPFSIYYPFVAFGEMLTLGNQIAVEFEPTHGLYVIVAGKDDKKTAMLANIPEADMEIVTNEHDLEVYIIDGEHLYTNSDLSSGKFVLKSYQTVVLKG